MGQALFYEDKYYLFSNWSAHAVTYQEIVYPTAEHAYHTQKFADSKIREVIRAAKSPLEAKTLANEQYKTQQKQNWDEVKMSVMYEIVRDKLAQHKEVQDILLSTGDNEIIENSPVDYFWGCGKDGRGRNELGKIWMKLRQEMRK